MLPGASENCMSVKLRCGAAVVPGGRTPPPPPDVALLVSNTPVSGSGWPITCVGCPGFGIPEARAGAGTCAGIAAVIGAAGACATGGVGTGAGAGAVAVGTTAALFGAEAGGREGLDTVGGVALGAGLAEAATGEFVFPAAGRDGAVFIAGEPGFATGDGIAFFAGDVALPAGGTDLRAGDDEAFLTTGEPPFAPGFTACAVAGGFAGPVSWGVCGSVFTLGTVGCGLGPSGGGSMPMLGKGAPCLSRGTGREAEGGWRAGCLGTLRWPGPEPGPAVGSAPWGGAGAPGPGVGPVGARGIMTGSGITTGRRLARSWSRSRCRTAFARISSLSTSSSAELKSTCISRILLTLANDGTRRASRRLDLKAFPTCTSTSFTNDSIVSRGGTGFAFAIVKPAERTQT